MRFYHRPNPADHLPASPRRRGAALSQSPRPFFSLLHELESRLLFASPTLTVLPNVTLYSGAPLQIPLDGNDADAADNLTFTVAITNNTGSVSGAISPATNRSLKITSSHVSSGAGDVAFTNESMVIKLFEDKAPKTTARITALAGAGFFNNLVFHRVINNFVIQGGDPMGDGTGGSHTVFDDEFDPSLQFTGSGLIAMAKSLDDTDDSQFFITEGSQRHLDFNHTIFGQLVEGESTRDKISNVLADANGKPINPVTMTSVTVIADKQNGVLSLSVPNGIISGSATITVTVKDPAGNSAVRSFTATVTGDTWDDDPFLGPVADVNLRAGGPNATAQLTATDIENTTPAWLDWGTIYQNFNGNGARYLPPSTGLVTVATDFNTGLVTISAAAGAGGVYPMYVGVAQTPSAFDSQVVPIFVTPAAPTSIDLLDASDTGVSTTDNLTRLNNANTAGKLQFLISGVLAGAQVQLFDGATLLGTATVPAAATSVMLTTNGSASLSNGVHNLTAVQTLKSLAWGVGNRTGTVDLASLASTSQAITIDTAAPTLVGNPVFDFKSGAHSLSYTFSDNVSASLTPADLTLLRLDDNSTTPAASIQVVYAANKATFTFPNYSGGTLPNGNYRATLPAANVTDAAGNPLPTGSVFDFFFLGGDVNRDRSVSFADLVIIGQNYGKTSQTYDQGDLTGDGAVGFGDLVLIAQNYGKTQPAPAAPVPDAPAASEAISIEEESAPVLAAPPDAPLAPSRSNTVAAAPIPVPSSAPAKCRLSSPNRTLFSSVPITHARSAKPPSPIKHRR